MQALHGSAQGSKAAACSLLQHVLLWQYLKHRSVMALVELALEHEASCSVGDGQLSARGAPRRSAFDVGDGSGSCFLTEVGVPLVKEAMELVCRPPPRCMTHTHTRCRASGMIPPCLPLGYLLTLKRRLS